MAQSDACPTSDQEVASSIPTGSGHILSWRLIIKSFHGPFAPTSLIQEERLSVSAKECAQNWFSAYRTKPAKEKYS